MDAVTAVSGSGPAYFALLAEAMIEAGILLGLSREISTQLVVQTMLGTAKLLRDEHMHPVELREAVTSPGGTTIRAIRELERAGVRAAFLNAIQAAMERSQELAQDDQLSDVELEVFERRRRPPRRRRPRWIAEAVGRRRPHRPLGRLGPAPDVRARRRPPPRLGPRRALVDRRALRAAGRRALELPDHPRVAARRARATAGGRPPGPRRAPARGRRPTSTTPRSRASRSTWR